MNKLLISLLSLVGASVVGTGGYFLFKGNEKKSEQKVEISHDEASDSVQTKPQESSQPQPLQVQAASGQTSQDQDSTIIHIPSSN